MKIAIQGHLTRGKEVIQILESLGGRNGHKLCGNAVGHIYHYHIDNTGNIIALSSKCDLHNYKFYTLEEFEKEFPFKIGDIVVTLDNNSYKIIALEYYNNKLCYTLDNGYHYTPQILKPYKEMSTRNITLTLDKAKEWYNKGGELKEIALQAFTKEELTKIGLPKTWEEFCTNYPIQDGEAIIDGQTSQIRRYNGITVRYLTHDKNVCPSIKSAEAHLATIQLEQLRDCWRQGWEPIWDCSEKWCIGLWGNELSIGTITNASKFLTFPTREMAEEFLECFRDLIEKAGDLI